MALLTLSLLVSFVLVFNFARTAEWFFPQFMMALPAVLAVKYCVLSFTGQHQRSWRYAGHRDALSTALALAIATTIIAGIFALFRELAAGTVWARIAAFPGAVLINDWLLSVALVMGARFAGRRCVEQARLSGAEGKRTLIIGAGDAGETLLREIQRMPREQYDIVGFLDDDPGKLGSRIRGVEVIGTTDCVKSLCDTRRVEQVLLAVPSAPRRRIRRIIQHCEGAGVRFRIVPGLAELIEGPVTIESQLRQVRVEDLLHRDPVVLDRGAIGRYLGNRTVLVTGAGGSIGSELCRQVIQFAPKRLVLVEYCENNLFEIERELGPRCGAIALSGCLADICDRARMANLFAEYNPDIVCHAAAHKHVPMLEAHPGEGLKNNILGTRTLADLAVAHGVDKFVYVSTDKAVNPTSIMGCTKRIAEMYVQGLSERHDTQFITVRFGNVLNSRGSVIPIFQEQIAAGGPLTITHPQITRYFMTIPEAAQLVLQAGSLGQGGEIFLLEMGEPVRIVDLARNLITLSGLTPDVDIPIRFTGLRPGEKLHEELYIQGEGLSPTQHPNIHVWRHRPEDWESLVQALPALLAQADAATVGEIQARLGELVPEYQADAQSAGRRRDPAAVAG